MKIIPIFHRWGNCGREVISKKATEPKFNPKAYVLRGDFLSSYVIPLLIRYVSPIRMGRIGNYDMNFC